MSAIDYKLRARSPWNWRDYATVRMEISVGQPYHEGRKLELALDWARGNFDRSVIILGDSPQRYNMMLEQGLTEARAEAQARAAGDEWLDRNANRLQGMEVTRWNDWKARSAYLPNRAAVSRLYTENANFRTAIREAMEGYASRRMVDAAMADRFYRNAEQYLLEETAVFATAYNELGGISAYPGDFLKLWDMFIGSNDPNVPDGLKNAHCARLSFTRLKTLQAA